MQQNIYIDYNNRKLVNSSGGVFTSDLYAHFIYQDDTILVINMIDDAGNKINISAVDTWELRVIQKLSSTENMILTQNENIDSTNAANGILTLSNDCDTTPFQTAVDGAEQRIVFAILIGYDAQGEIFNTWKFKIISESVYGSTDAPGIPTNSYAKKSEVLTLDNTTEFTPDADYEPATKKYVDDNLESIVSTTGTELTGKYAKFAAESTLQGQTVEEVRSDLNIEDGSEANNISNENASNLTSGGEISLHYHNLDRDRSNHSGTQTANTISDFSNEVKANAFVNSGISLPLNIPGVLSTTSANAMTTIAKFPVLWNLPNAKIIECKAFVLTAVSTGTAPSCNLLLNGVNSLASDIQLTETEATGTIDVANNTIDTNQYIEVDFDAGNADAEDLIIFLKFELR